MRPLLAALSLILYTVLAVHPAHAPSSFQNPFHQVQSPRQTHVRRIAIIGMSYFILTLNYNVF